MKIVFQYHGIQRTEAHEEMVRSHLQTVLEHAPQITSVIIHTEQDHEAAAKIRLEVHMPPGKNFNGHYVLHRGESMEHATVAVVKALSNWIGHKKSKMVDHGHVPGHPFQQANEASA